jgi:dihydroxy-acid dehydratase
MWEMGAAVERGELPRQDLQRAQRGACPTCGACQFMGSASTGQVLAEALGLAVHARAGAADQAAAVRPGERQTARLADPPGPHATAHPHPGGVRERDHRARCRRRVDQRPPARAADRGEAGIEVTIDDFDRIHRRVPVLANVMSTGRYPAEYLWYAGGVPAVMLELQEMLHLGCLTVTGKTLGENLDDIEHDPFFFTERRGYLNNVKVAREEIIRPLSDPFGADGGVAVLYGNLAPGGAMIKTFSVPREMRVHIGPARVFDFEEEAIHALVKRRISPGERPRHPL